MEFRDLLSFAETNHFFADLAATIFKQKHSQKVIKFSFPHKNKHRFATNDDIYETDDTIYVKNVSSIFQTLKYFGRSILKLKIQYVTDKFDQHFVSSISEAINIHCSDRLTQLDIQTSSPYFFDGISKPFSNVEYVQLNGHFASLETSTMNFIEIFPSIRRLSLTFVHLQNQQNMDWTIPLLEDLHVTTRYCREAAGLFESELEEILRKNPQIQKLSLSGISQEFLSTKLNTILPDLENLKILSKNRIHTRDFHRQQVIFKNMKSFSTYWEMEHFPFNVEFKNLTELNVADSFESKYNWWIEYLDNNENLKRFNINLGEISDDDLTKLTDKKLNLEEVSLVLSRRVADRTVVNFVEKNDKMKRICFEKCKYMEDDMETKAKLLIRELSDKWKITYTADKIQLRRI